MNSTMTWKDAFQKKSIFIPGNIIPQIHFSLQPYSSVCAFDVLTQFYDLYKYLRLHSYSGRGKYNWLNISTKITQKPFDVPTLVYSLKVPISPLTINTNLIFIQIDR